jgi:hypothetical protein
MANLLRHFELPATRSYAYMSVLYREFQNGNVNKHVLASEDHLMLSRQVRLDLTGVIWHVRSAHAVPLGRRFRDFLLIGK